jgi:hypothetical protein
MSQPTAVRRVTPPAAPSRLLVIGVVEDEVRAQQAARALDVWRRANRRLGIGPIAVVARRASGTVSSRTMHVLRPGSGALVGLLIGLLLFGLPAVGAAAAVAWAVGSALFGMLGLVGAVPASQVGTLVVILTIGAAMLAFVLVGLVGAVLGTLIGLLVGAIDSAARGISNAEVRRTVTLLAPGAWAAVARTPPTVAPIVSEELERLGAASGTRPAGPDVAVPPPAVEAPAAAVPEPTAPPAVTEPAPGVAGPTGGVREPVPAAEPERDGDQARVASPPLEA